jgi:hypothetical protein
MLLEECRDTQNALYPAAINKIDTHYREEEVRILSHADSNVKRFLEDISSTFKV